MQYSQVDIALGFLEPNSYIVLQVPYWRDTELIYRYLYDKFGMPTKRTPKYAEWNIGRIYVEVVSEHSGYGIALNQLFFIDRDHDRRYLEYFI